ncbi:putative phosphoribosyltransferase [Streptacidiphilus sp. MAP12-16]
MFFADRPDAGRRLAERLEHLREDDPVVLGLPRGGVLVAEEVAAALGAPLDVLVVRKLGVPSQPELAMGAIGEGSVRVINDDVVRMVGASEAALTAVESAERAELERRAALYRGNRRRVDLHGRTAVVVDDGIATGATARAACRMARAQGAARVVLATPVASPGWSGRMEGVADEFVCLETPGNFFGIGWSYVDFSQTPDEDVIASLDRAAARAGRGGSRR